MRQKLFAVVMFLMVGMGTGFAQQGFLKGKITDKNTGEELVGAAVVIDGTTIGTITNFMGEYIMPALDAGTYTIRVQYISYDPLVFNDVTIKSGEETELNIQLAEATMDIAEVSVVAKKNRESENLLLMEQKQAVIATQAIGAQELSRKGVSDAEGAVQKISGISKQEGAKNVFVRGLGDRYNSTTLNGFPLPSEDPEYKNVALDIFTSDMIQSIGVNKVFSAGTTGDVGGAHINVISKELVGDGDFEVGLEAGFNNQIGDKTFLKTDGVNSLGFANLDGRPMEGSFSRSDINSYDFSNSLDPSTYNTPANRSLSLAGGKSFGELKKHSFFLVGAIGSDFYYENGVSRKTTSNDPTPYQDFNYDKFVQHTQQMAMGNLSLSFGDHQIAYHGLYIHDNNQYYSEFIGVETEIFQNTDESEGMLRRQQINDNSVIVNQAIYDWNFSERTKLDAGVALNTVNGNEPDRRTNYFTYLTDEDLYEFRVGDGRHQRFYSSLKETDLNLRAGVKYKITSEENNASSIKIGYTGRFVNRDFNAPIYNHDWNLNAAPELPKYNPNNILLDNTFNQDRFANNHFFVEYYEDYYTVKNNINGGYADLIYQLNAKLTANVGLKADIVDVTIDYNVNKGGSQGSNKIEELYVLPSLNLKYDLSDKNSLRGGFSMTYTLPQAKEISPFIYIGPTFSSQGNPLLNPSKNYNIDVKWDNYLSPGEILTINAFYKQITNPIARVDLGNSAGLLTYDNISESATAAGIELEFRKKLLNSNVGDKIQNVSFGLNGSYIYTNVELDSKSFAQNTSSQLEGASPIIINTDISYRYRNQSTLDWTSSIILNYFSDKVHTIGTRGFNNIEETGRPTLDFVSSAKLNQKWGIKIKATNLLNPNVELVREAKSGVPPVVLEGFKKGVSFSFGISYTL